MQIEIVDNHSERYPKCLVDGVEAKLISNNTRYVYAIGDIVVKVELSGWSTQNIEEALLWDQIKDTEDAEHFVPVLDAQIDQYPTWLVMPRLDFSKCEGGPRNMYAGHFLMNKSSKDFQDRYTQAFHIGRKYNITDAFEDGFNWVYFPDKGVVIYDYGLKI